MRRFAHACVVGGSGMLSGLCRRLLDESDAVSVLARNEARIRAVDPRIVPVCADYGRAGEAPAALRACFARHGAPDLLVTWIHPSAPALRRALAELVRPQGRYVQILGSAAADPAQPERLARLRAPAEGLALRPQIVVLGFVVEAGGARWLSDAEISDGVYDAIARATPLAVIGTVEPWSARP